jgi:hypothetical protein
VRARPGRRLTSKRLGSPAGQSRDRSLFFVRARSNQQRLINRWRHCNESRGDAAKTAALGEILRQGTHAETARAAFRYGTLLEDRSDMSTIPPRRQRTESVNRSDCYRMLLRKPPTHAIHDLNIPDGTACSARSFTV